MPFLFPSSCMKNENTKFVSIVTTDTGLTPALAEY
jgi:hypothetical protein